MTILEDAPPQIDEAAARPERTAARPTAGLPWLVVLALLLAAWWRSDVQVADIAAYVAYWLLCLLLPGTLVHRALRGSRGNLPEDVGYGAATGLVLELGAWASAAALGQQHLLRWWPVPAVSVFLAVPRLRRHWRISERKPLPLGWHWTMAGVLILIIGWAALQWPDAPLPPATYSHNLDLYYHLALVHELTRGMPFEVPQMAGEPLHYHYLSDAHVASAGMITGTTPVVVLLRLWIVPVLVTAAMVTAALARDLTGRWWAGPVSAAVAYLGIPVPLRSPMVDGSGAMAVASPSQTYVLPLFVVLVGLCVEVVRGRRLGPGWVLLPALGLACAGSKLSTLPPLVCGLLVVAAASGWLRHRVPRATIAALASLVAATAVGYRLFSGAGAGTIKVQALGLLHLYPPYNQTMGVDDGYQVGGLVPPGLAGAGAADWLFACGIVAWWLLMQAPRLVGILILASRERRVDPAAGLLTAVVVTGAAGTWAFFHPTASQYYFYLGVLPFGALLGAWLLTAARAPWPVPVAAGLAGVVAQLAVPVMARPAATRTAWTWALIESAARLIAFAAGAALVGVGLAVLLRRRSTDRAFIRDRRGVLAMAAAGVSAALLAASIAGGVTRTIQHGLAGRYGALLFDRPLPLAANRQWLLVTREEMAAALWLDAHAADDDVVATNVHCRPARNVPNCDSRAFWVTGLAGRRAVIESWAYTDGALAAHGRDGQPYARQPAPDPARYALNERVFRAPDAADLARLRQEYGVRWLFADTNAGRVSPRLADLAQVRLVAGPVTIFELP